MQSLKIEEFLAVPGVVLDVRSPSEYIQGRIPGAISLPLFDDTERAAVGTLYKQAGKAKAVELGLEYAGTKLRDLVLQAKQVSGDTVAKVHCWRGGMRSSSVAWLLKTAGLNTATLEGGYKSFRRMAHTLFEKPMQFVVIGGFTGSGKSAILHALKSKNQQVLDLEEIASHRGSAYGVLGMPPQPSTEQFENEIANRLRQFSQTEVVWVEDESRMIGKCKIPDPLFDQIKSASLYFVDRPKSERIESLMADYGKYTPTQLIEATMKIERKLGGKRAHEVIESIRNGYLVKAIDISLEYYDAAYRFGLSKKKQSVIHRQVEGLDANQIAEQLIKERT